MLKRLRRLRISLAAKCQLLFGAAVVAIIAAALFVPWQRMEQLTEQLNERAASTLADRTIAEHVARRLQHSSDEATEADTPPPSGDDEGPSPATLPANTPEGKFALLPPPRLAGFASTAERDRLTPFEKRAADHFIREPDAQFYARYYQARGGEGYRYARPVYATADCVQCHTRAAAATLPAARGGMPTTVAAAIPPLPTTTAAVARPEDVIGLVSVDISSQVESNQLLLNRVFILTAGMVAGTLAIIVFYLITTQLILQPVRVLQETAEKVSEGDLNIRSDISTGDEFEVLSDTFNTMLVNLKSSSDQLRAMNKSLDLKLNQLAESNLALYESNRLKSEFLANVSHELRTPLNSILGFADLLKEAATTTGDGKSSRYVQNILNSGKNLLELINDLLDLAKIEAGRMEVRAEPLLVGDLFEGLGSILKPLCTPKNLSIVTSVGNDVPVLQTDPAKLQQVLYNFLSNAIKFSPPGGKIDVTARRVGDRVRVSVSDQGSGIEPEKQQVIFEKFRQIDGSVTREHGGTGLGLAISKELAQLLGGTIGVKSEEGAGAMFWVEVPVRIEATVAEVRGVQIEN